MKGGLIGQGIRHRLVLHNETNFLGSIDHVGQDQEIMHSQTYFAAGKAGGKECLPLSEGLVQILQRPDHVIVSDQ